MSIDQVEKVFKEISNYTGHICLHVKGEPLLHPHLREILNIAEENSLRVNLTTNGSLINKYDELLLNSQAIRQISFSLQSIENYKTKNEKKNYLFNIFSFTRKALADTEIYIDYRLWNIETRNKGIKEIDNITIEPENKCIKEIYNWDIQQVDLLNADNINHQNESLSNAKILEMISEEFLDKNVLNEEVYEGKGIKLINNLYLSQSEQFQWPDLRENIINEIGFCYGLKSQIAILADGTVVPCCLDEKGIISLGNIFKNSLQDILSSKRATEFSKGFSENKVIEELCKRCGFRQRFNNTK